MKYTEDQKNKIIEELYAKSSRKLFNYLAKYRMPIEQREDVVQEAFARAFDHLDQFKSKAKIETWLFSIANNIALNIIRAYRCKKRNRSEFDNYSYGMLHKQYNAGSIINPLIQSELNQMVDKIIVVKYREKPIWQNIMREVFFHNTPYAELAEIHGVTTGMIRRHKFKTGRRILERLRAQGIV